MASCIKPWSTHNWITATTIGGHCSSAAHNSAYECAATCSASTARLAAPQCAGQAWRPAGACVAMPCALLPLAAVELQGTVASFWFVLLFLSAAGERLTLACLPRSAAAAAATARNFTRTCAQHAPCNPDVTDPAHPNGPCHCCDLALDTAVVDSNPEAREWLSAA